jgi:hypothetical protein
MRWRQREALDTLVSKHPDEVNWTLLMTARGRVLCACGSCVQCQTFFIPLSPHFPHPSRDLCLRPRESSLEYCHT